MKIALIVVGAIAAVAIAIELAGNIVARRAKARFDRMSPDEQRKHQETMYKRQQMG